MLPTIERQDLIRAFSTPPPDSTYGKKRSMAAHGANRLADPFWDAPLRNAIEIVFAMLSFGATLWIINKYDDSPRNKRKEEINDVMNAVRQAIEGSSPYITKGKPYRVEVRVKVADSEQDEPMILTFYANNDVTLSFPQAPPLMMCFPRSEEKKVAVISFADFQAKLVESCGGL